ncbi:Protein kinase [Hondaea fermentalgiana]|uniref:Protein kinase n=1 Tax=Hondaea fermentalgiana TaxID=2315210 RepID=A0A2R5GHD7_9STRA|nr:Protein kinase [Hondaea fermentalgiana]|eukprot:GBG27284.1 Protein kinase [Hondaea fermentalgiana]
MDKYEVVRHIGQGAFGEVTECIERVSGDRVAVKVISNRRYDTWDECLKLREVRALRALKSNHKNIVVLRQIVRENKKLYLVFDYHPRNLHARIQEVRQRGGCFGLDLIARWTYQLVSALAYMHRYGFFHRDIKPENLLLDSDDGIQVCDFGLARDVRSRPPFTSYVSTKWYRAPELVLRATMYNSPVDIWAAACVAAECLTLKPLFPAQDKVEHMLMITSRVGPVTSKSWPQGSAMLLKQHLQLPPSKASAPLSAHLVSEFEKLESAEAVASPALRHCVSLIVDMLQLDPHARPSAPQCLAHPFLKECNERVQTLRDGLQHDAEPDNFKVDTTNSPSGLQRQAKKESKVTSKNVTRAKSPRRNICRRDSELKILTQEIDELTREIQDISTSPDGASSGKATASQALLPSSSVLDTSQLGEFAGSASSDGNGDDSEETSCTDTDSEGLPPSPMRTGVAAPPRIPFGRTSSMERRRVVSAYLQTLDDDDDDDDDGDDDDNDEGDSGSDSTSEKAESDDISRRLAAPPTTKWSLDRDCSQKVQETLAAEDADAGQQGARRAESARDMRGARSFRVQALQQDIIAAEEIPVKAYSARERVTSVEGPTSPVSFADQQQQQQQQDAIEICSIGSEFSPLQQMDDSEREANESTEHAEQPAEQQQVCRRECEDDLSMLIEGKRPDERIDMTRVSSARRAAPEEQKDTTTTTTTATTTTETTTRPRPQIKMKARWLDSRRVDDKEIERSLLPIPEPVHRLPAGRIGMSLRARRRASPETLRETCWFYEEKCAGKYDCKSLAARYLFELAREVQEQADDLERLHAQQEDRTNYLEACMREWDETFGPVRSLDKSFVKEAEQLRVVDGARMLASSIGTREGLGKQLDSLQIVSPARLKALIDEYVEKVCRLDAELKTQRSKYAERERKFAAEMADYARVVRSQASAELERLSSSHRAEVTRLESNHHKEVSKLEAALKVHDRSHGGLHRRVRDLEAAVEAAKHETEAQQKQKLKAIDDLREHKKLADNEWAGLYAKARTAAEHEHAKKMEQLRQRAQSMQRQIDETRARGERRLAVYERDVVKPLEAKLLTQEKTSEALRTENAYLRTRVKELNRLMAAFRVAVQDDS